ncbi:MAG: hypothetical protein ACPG5B_14965 [Chitinophagales bacterium]
MAKKKTKNEKEDKSLKNYNININSFGEVESNMTIDEINAFLNKNTKDKKLQKDKK